MVLYVFISLLVERISPPLRECVLLVHYIFTGEKGDHPYTRGENYIGAPKIRKKIWYY